MHKGNLYNDQKIFDLTIIFFILMSLMFNSGLILLGETR